MMNIIINTIDIRDWTNPDIREIWDIRIQICLIYSIWLRIRGFRISVYISDYLQISGSGSGFVKLINKIKIIIFKI